MKKLLILIIKALAYIPVWALIGVIIGNISPFAARLLFGYDIENLSIIGNACFALAGAISWIGIILLILLRNVLFYLYIVIKNN